MLPPPPQSLRVCIVSAAEPKQEPLGKARGNHSLAFLREGGERGRGKKI